MSDFGDVLGGLGDFAGKVLGGVAQVKSANLSPLERAQRDLQMRQLYGDTSNDYAAITTNGSVGVSAPLIWGAVVLAAVVLLRR